MTIELEWHW